MKALINFIKNMRYAFPSCAKKAAKDQLSECGALPKASDIELGTGWKSNWDPNTNRYGGGEYTSFRDTKTGKNGELFFPGSANWTCDEKKAAIARTVGNGLIKKKQDELTSSGPAKLAKWIGGAIAALGAAQLAGCNPGGREQELYDIFDAAQLEGEMDPVELFQRAMRQAQRNQQNGRGGCNECTYSVVEAGEEVNYGDSCEPPDKFKPPEFPYPGYMELRKNCD